MSTTITLEEGEKILWSGKPTQNTWAVVVHSGFMPILSMLGAQIFLLTVPSLLDDIQRVLHPSSIPIESLFVLVLGIIMLICYTIIVLLFISYVRTHKNLEYIVTNKKIFLDTKRQSTKMPFYKFFLWPASNVIPLQKIQSLNSDKKYCKEGEENIRIKYGTKTWLGNTGARLVMAGVNNAQEGVRIINEQLLTK